ncbi:hypothetical protein LJC35_04270 [Parabacteroides sp. OttesenSCG-928-N08]|nr:hypothetical protein [Parabacteroides sp. OttesenSCG-928-N08]
MKKVERERRAQGIFLKEFRGIEPDAVVGHTIDHILPTVARRLHAEAEIAGQIGGKFVSLHDIIIGGQDHAAHPF